jgi:hypothetical protein
MPSPSRAAPSGRHLGDNAPGARSQKAAVRPRPASVGVEPPKSPMGKRCPAWPEHAVRQARVAAALLGQGPARRSDARRGQSRVMHLSRRRSSARSPAGSDTRPSDHVQTTPRSNPLHRLGPRSLADPNRPGSDSVALEPPSHPLGIPASGSPHHEATFERTSTARRRRLPSGSSYSRLNSNRNVPADSGPPRTSA